MNVRLSTPRRLAAIAIAVSMAIPSLTACGDDSTKAPTDANAPVTLTWWHNAAQEPGQGVWQGIADAYHQAHPNVTFKVEPAQNEALKTKISVALQSPNPPSIFQQWGGGALATQVQSGKIMDLTDSVKPWIGDLGPAAGGWQVEGKQYGIPFDLHVVGFWYRTDLFASAGISGPPKTMAELNDDVAKLKAKNITPISIGSKDKWPDAFWWSYFAIRECSTDTVKSTVKNLKMDDPCWVKAGEDLKTFLATNPFQNAFLGTPAQQGAGSSAGLVANGKAAMELQGDWELPTMIPLTEDKQFASKLSWFPFPASTAARAPRAPRSAVATASPARSRPGRRAPTSSSTSPAPTCRPSWCRRTRRRCRPTRRRSRRSRTRRSRPSRSTSTGRRTSRCTSTRRCPTSVGSALNDAIADFFAGKGTPAGHRRRVHQGGREQVMSPWRGRVAAATAPVKCRRNQVVSPWRRHHRPGPAARRRDRPAGRAAGGPSGSSWPCC